MGFQGWSEALVLQEQVGWNGSKQCRRLGGATMGIHLKFNYWSATQQKMAYGRCYRWVTLLRRSTQPTIGNCWGVIVGLRSRVAAPNLR